MQSEGMCTVRRSKGDSGFNVIRLSITPCPLIARTKLPLKIFGNSELLLLMPVLVYLPLLKSPYQVLSPIFERGPSINRNEGSVAISTSRGLPLQRLLKYHCTGVICRLSDM